MSSIERKETDTQPADVPSNGFVARLAVVFTLLNAIKPVVVDDTAYLLFARQLAAHPLNPYGFSLYWYAEPQPAMQILLPPVLPYWLALGLSIFGENVLLLKLWQFPFALLLACSAKSLLARFLRRPTRGHLAVLVLGPAVLPFGNFMLDVPALSLELAAVVFAWRTKRGWASTVGVGVLVGLAIQTKYSVLFLPVVLLAAGFVRHRVREAVGMVVVAGIVFAAWESWLLVKYGQSHFVYHLTDPNRTQIGRSLLILPLLSHGGLTLGWVILLGAPPRWWKLAIPALGVGWLAMFVGPSEHGIKFPSLFFLVLGATAGIVVLSCCRATRRGWRSRVLFVWLAIELLAYFTVTPFPAGRRVLAVSFVAAILVFRTHERIAVDLRWPFGYALLSGLAVFGIDVWDAKAERDAAREIATRMAELSPQGRGYFLGHWGFQYYAEREGMTAWIPGRTQLRPGDWLTVPTTPRPTTGSATIPMDASKYRLAFEVSIDDRLRIGTIPTLYGGRAPLEHRNGPRLQFRVYRVVNED
jgi:hypothetical protein